IRPWQRSCCQERRRGRRGRPRLGPPRQAGSCGARPRCVAALVGAERGPPGRSPSRRRGARMDLREALQSRIVPIRFRPDAVARERRERVLAAAASTPSFADQHPIRLLVVEDADTKQALRGACEAQRKRWFVETADWVATALEGAGERRQLVALTEAPHVVCI